MYGISRRYLTSQTRLRGIYLYTQKPFHTTKVQTQLKVVNLISFTENIFFLLKKGISRDLVQPVSDKHCKTPVILQSQQKLRSFHLGEGFVLSHWFNLGGKEASCNTLAQGLKHLGRQVLQQYL